ncbi:hypothetical protein GOBAR_AA33156 [Gossypium barbadense]|uniref:Uncharacterized protein n=1 Tax=Gossypium barbadense TaxID=3634 RepID=A0A2P5W902_GOSBA|nr:hypothetical protein GOBAR_AA33156 [Gossypium barbadense]
MSRKCREGVLLDDVRRCGKLCGTGKGSRCMGGSRRRDKGARDSEVEGSAGTSGLCGDLAWDREGVRMARTKMAFGTCSPGNVDSDKCRGVRDCSPGISKLRAQWPVPVTVSPGTVYPFPVIGLNIEYSLVIFN